jgi:hypothetical protein
MDPTRLASSTAANARENGRVDCPYRLHEVVDVRHGGKHAGGLGVHAFAFADASALVRRQLLEAGLVDGGAEPLPVVSVRLAQLYLTQNLTTKVPVAVYQVSIDEGPLFVVRAQSASMNWGSSQDEAYEAYAIALSDVNRRLVEQLNARCAGALPRPGEVAHSQAPGPA